MGEFLTNLSYWGVPVAITGFLFWLLQRQIIKQSEERDKAEAERERRAIEREKSSEHLMLLMLQSLRAAIVLSEATARAVQRIPDAKCNGDMSKALDYVKQTQNAQKDFLFERGIHSIYDKE